VDVIGTLAVPASELDAELERPVGGSKKLGLVEAEADDEVVDLRDRRLADPDGADLVGFDQRDRGAVAEEAGEGCGGDPSSRSAASNDNIEWLGPGH
jgi:hypothetical protein